MKLEELLMERNDDSFHRKQELQEEVADLQEQLEKELQLKQILRCALHGHILCHSCLCTCSLIPIEVQALLAELAILEEEIICLERKVGDLKLYLYQWKKQKNEGPFWQQQKHLCWRQQQRHILSSSGNQKENVKEKKLPELPNAEKTDDEAEKQRRHFEPNKNVSFPDKEMSSETPNSLSEILIKSLIEIYHKLHQKSDKSDCASNNDRKLNISCMRSRSLHLPKSSLNLSSSKSTTHMLDHCRALSELDGKTCGDAGAYKKFMNLTRSSMDLSRISLCLSDIGRLRALMHTLCNVQICSMTYKQKLAFWINIYNASIMHAFLEYGLPPSPDRLLTLLKKAAINVGGLTVNALAIEHFILRHSSDTETGLTNEKEVVLRHDYGLGYPEPNVTFALSRGTESSPALRVYTAEDVINELERAKIEYLEASVTVTSCKKKIIVPNLLLWHIRDFADDVESLIEWIYSQLPRSGSLKRMLKDCFSRDQKIPLIKMVEIEPYKAEFRYLLPSPGHSCVKSFYPD